MKNAILDAENLAYDLLYRTMGFCAKNRQICLYTETNIRNVEGIVAALVEDLITKRLRWANNPPDTHRQPLAKMVQWFDPDSLEPRCDSFFREVYDPFIDELETLIGRAVPSNTWYMWSILHVRGSIIIQKGRDYRVVEWERITGYQPVRKQVPKRRGRPAGSATTANVVQLAPRRGKSKEQLTREQAEMKALRENDAFEEAIGKELQKPISRV